jgi:hypothetical protein
VGAAREIALLEAQVAEHFFYECDVLGLTTMRRACNRKLLIAPSQLVESAARQEGHDLKRFRGGSPEGHCARIAGAANELVAVRNHRGVYAMVRFHRVSAGQDNVELMVVHYIIKIP